MCIRIFIFKFKKQQNKKQESKKAEETNEEKRTFAENRLKKLHEDFSCHPHFQKQQYYFFFGLTINESVSFIEHAS